MAKTIAVILGVVFLLVGVLGFAAPHLLGAHLSTTHNIIHLVSGAISLYLGLKGSFSAVKTFCLVFGAVYLLLGIAGFALGTGAELMLAVIPGALELGRVDHVIHVVLGSAYLLGGVLPSSAAR